MKSIILFILTIMYSIVALAQYERKHALDFGDVFVVKVGIKKDVLSKKCPCNKRKKCVLSEVVVSNVIYCPPNKNFDSIKLLTLKYILFASSERSMLKTDSSFIISVKPSGSKYYLAFSKILKIDDAENCQFYHPYAYLSELSPCKRKDTFERYILKQ